MAPSPAETVPRSGSTTTSSDISHLESYRAFASHPVLATLYNDDRRLLKLGYNALRVVSAVAFFVGLVILARHLRAIHPY